ncbi:putative transposase for the insertion element IS2606 [Mycobacterium ulcerans str. Harvey]|uniref:Transposase for the insertion element IS2606 n=1 Tax=Mycobacterium ulcerans str. Harvey TaxID=1299332 RepID=A0ABP3AUE3_MYCUL|nr:putative transposase for the insertion element IS2606 [Mycobacterium ulcerans str. Harvey]
MAAIDVPSSRDVDELEVARELVRQAREAGVGLTGLAIAQGDDQNGH